MLYREFGCDAVLCRRGTFNQHGHATLHSACRPCPAILDLDDDDDDKYLSNVLGRTKCDGLETINGDVIFFLRVDDNNGTTQNALMRINASKMRINARF